MIRSIRPTDLVSLMAFHNCSLPNEAKTRDQLNGLTNPTLRLGAFLEQWLSLEEHRHSWISIEERQIQGLISIRARSGHSIWEIDRLLLRDNGRAEDICLALLDFVAAIGGEIGIEKVFLRLMEDSPLISAARHAGFSPYTRETLYIMQDPKVGWEESIAGLWQGLRLRSSHDEQQLFRLYNIAVPIDVRRLEAMTIREWKDSQGRDHERWSKREFVLEKDGCIKAWLQVASKARCGRFDLLVHPEEEERLDLLLRYCLSHLEGKERVTCLVPDYKIKLHGLLEEFGALPSGDYISLVKQLTVRIRVPSFAPARA